MFRHLCTDYVSNIDRLFHAPTRVACRISLAKEWEVVNAKRIARLRDGVSETVSSDTIRLWEGF